MSGNPYCEDCDCMMETGDEVFICPKCGDTWGWDSYYEFKASLRGGW